MSTCFSCGKSIPPDQRQQRRKVKTGEWVRKRYPKPTIGAVQTSYGIRTVCSSCSRKLDMNELRGEFLGIAKIVALLAILFLLLLFPNLL